MVCVFRPQNTHFFHVLAFFVSGSPFMPKWINLKCLCLVNFLFAFCFVKYEQNDVESCLLFAYICFTTFNMKTYKFLMAAAFAVISQCFCFVCMWYLFYTVWSTNFVFYRLVWELSFQSRLTILNVSQ